MLTEAQILATEMERSVDKIPVMFERDDTFYSTIDKDSNVEKVSNRDLRVPLELRPGGQAGHFNPDGGDLGLGDGPTFEKGLIPVAHLKYGVQWTKLAEWATDDVRKATVNTFRHLMANAMKEFRRFNDSLCMTDGTGTLATVSGVTTGGGFHTVVCNATGDGFGVRLLRYGQPVSFYASNLLTLRAGGEKQISYYDAAAKTFKVPITVTGLANGDKVVVSGLTATPPVSILGVPYHQNGSSTGTWLGLDRATTPEIRGNRINAASSLALPFARRALNAIGERVGKDNMRKVTAWMHPAQQQAYEELGMMTSVINRSSSGGGDLDLFFNDNMRIAGAPIKTSFSWDKTRIDFIVNDAWGRAEMKKPGFYEVDGRKIFEIRGASGGVATSQIFYLTASWNLFMKNPILGSYIDGLTVPTGY